MNFFKYIFFPLSFLISLIITFLIQEFYLFDDINYFKNNIRKLSDSVEKDDNETALEKAQKLKKFFKKLEKKFTEQIFDGEVNYINYTEFNANDTINITNSPIRTYPFINKFVYIYTLLIVVILIVSEIKIRNLFSKIQDNNK